MTEDLKLIIVMLILIIVYAFSRKFHAWKIKRALIFVIQDLKEKGAFTREDAVELPYARQSIFRVGMRDYRPKALEYLVRVEVVGKTPQGKYFLLKAPERDW